MRRIKLTLEYDGTRYAGWQVQANGETVQERVEEALRPVIREKVRIHGAGRTDAGVHASGQVAHFETESRLPPENIRDGANTHLPSDIVLLRAEEVDPSFHARYSARGKVYRYRVLLRDVRSPLERHRAFQVSPPLNVEEIRLAADILLGEHDFSAFTASGSSARDPVRTLFRMEIAEREEFLEFELEGNGFLYKMVRNIVGTLIEVGKGTFSSRDIEGILASMDRKKAGPTAPACGLYLLRVIY